MSAVPPYAALLGARPDGDGWVIPFASAVMGRPGFLHGGALGGLLEVAAHAALDGQGRLELVTMTIDYPRPGTQRETRIAARVVRLGDRIAQLEASAWQDGPDRPIATGRFTYRRG